MTGASGGRSGEPLRFLLDGDASTYLVEHDRFALLLEVAEAGKLETLVSHIQQDQLRLWSTEDPRS